MTAMKHMCFLRDPRTEVVVGEPRYDLPIIPRLIAYLPQEFNRVCHLSLDRKCLLTLCARNSRCLTSGQCTSSCAANDSSKRQFCTRKKAVVTLSVYER